MENNKFTNILLMILTAVISIASTLIIGKLNHTQQDVARLEASQKLIREEQVENSTLIKRIIIQDDDHLVEFKKLSVDVAEHNSEAEAWKQMIKELQIKNK